MKKLILTLLAVSGMTLANAQSGSWLLYGNVDFNLYHMKDGVPETQQRGAIMPGLGYQFNDHWTVGVAGGYALLSTKDTVTKTTKRWNTSEYRAGVFARYTQPVSPIFSLYTQLDLGYMGGNTTFDNQDIAGQKFSGFYAMLTPAVMVNVHNGFALNFGFGGLGYTSRKYDKADNPNTNFSLTFGKQISIGVSKNFGGHKMHGHHEPMDETRKLNTKDDE